MSYSLGQAKWIPGQIHFATTKTGRLPNVQPLIEAGLPYAPYIEHGSYTTGMPDIARYGRDPYRGLGAEESAGTQSNSFAKWMFGLGGLLGVLVMITPSDQWRRPGD